MDVGIIGAGKIGESIATLLETCGFCERVRLGDSRPLEDISDLEKAEFKQLDVARPAELESFITDCDAVVSAAPYYLNKTIAEVCAKHETSYFDLTEDVETTNYVRILSKNSRATFMLQCGLAPGAINIIASVIANLFKSIPSVE
jgi:saccharopine dehydrogenase-like NADP-dependent oxidoreductase